MASNDNSNGVAPSIAGFGGSSGSPGSGSPSSSSFEGAGDARTTPAQNAGGSGPQGPNAAGLNPGSVTTPSVPAPSSGANTEFQSIASQLVTGGGTAGVEPPTPAKPYDEKELVQSLADTLKVKATKGEPLEVAVVNALADKFGVKIANRGKTTTGTGTGQGSVGQARHDIASWFGTAVNTVASAFVPGQAAKQTAADTKNVDQEFDAKKAAAMKITSPKLREQALAKINKQEQQALASGQVPQGGQPGIAQPVPDENSKALNQIVTQVAQKLGVSATGPDALQDIAKSPQVNAPTETAASGGSPGAPQTYAQNYAAFTKAWAANKKLPNGETFQQQWVANLENGGLLNADINTATTSEQQQTQSKGGPFLSTTVASGPDEQQVFNAYQTLLVNSAQAKQSPQAYLQASASNATTQTLANGAPSEMYAFVQGVGTEMGVYLSPAQINQLSNFYGASASTADDPQSVEDQIKDSVVALYDPTNPNNPAGVASTMFEDIKSSALSYQIPISDSQIGNMVKTDLQGTTVESMYVAADAAEAAATKHFQEQAQGLYPALSSQIAAGQTVQNLVAPYMNVAEAVTGVPAATMTADMSTGGVSKWSAFLQGGTNPSGSTQVNNATGKAATTQPQMMTLDQWKTYLMQTPSYGFQNTQGARDMAEQLSAAILNEFGKVNTMGGTSTPFNAYNGQSDLSANTGGV